MKKVYQTTISNENGDCFAACLATLLGLKPRQIPDFFALGEYKCQNLIFKFLRKINLSYVCIDSPMGPNNYLNLTSVIGMYCILIVKSQLFPGIYHSVVGRVKLLRSGVAKFEIIHDPNKENEKYPDDTNILSVYFLAPIEPWRKINKLPTRRIK